MFIPAGNVAILLGESQIVSSRHKCCLPNEPWLLLRLWRRAGLLWRQGLGGGYQRLGGRRGRRHGRRQHDHVSRSAAAPTHGSDHLRRPARRRGNARGDRDGLGRAGLEARPRSGAGGADAAARRDDRGRVRRPLQAGGGGGRWLLEDGCHCRNLDYDLDNHTLAFICLQSCPYLSFEVWWHDLYEKIACQI